MYSLEYNNETILLKDLLNKVLLFKTMLEIYYFAPYGS